MAGKDAKSFLHSLGADAEGDSDDDYEDYNEDEYDDDNENENDITSTNGISNDGIIEPQPTTTTPAIKQVDIEEAERIIKYVV